MGHGDPSETPKGPTMDQMDSAFKATSKQPPKWTIGARTKVVIGAPQPSWTESVPGPKYTYDLNLVKERQPNYTMRTKPEMVIGGGVPSWTNTIPGPKYHYDTNIIKTRQPVFTIRGRGKEPRSNSSSTSPAGERPTTEQMDKGYKLTTPQTPQWSLAAKIENGVGSFTGVSSAMKSMPGPKYTYDPDTIRRKPPKFTIGSKLPSESDLMKARSPGIIYGGAAMDAKKQELVDSTRHRTPAPSFGIGDRWEGISAKMARSGSLGRYERGRYLGIKVSETD